MKSPPIWGFRGTTQLRRPLARARCLVVIALLAPLALPHPLHGQDAGSAAGLLWKGGQSAFTSGDFATAAKDFDTIIKSSALSAVKWSDTPTLTPPPPLATWLEPAFYMLGASYFNLKDWPNAIVTFTRYRKLFPRSPHLAEVTFSLAQAQFFGGHQKEAIPLLNSLLPSSSYHQKCVMLLAECYKQTSDLPGAITLLEAETKLPNLQADYLGKINLKLLGFYENDSQIDKAVALLREIDDNITHTPDIVEFNNLAVHLGDVLLGKHQISDALNCYRRVRNNDQVIEIQRQQIASLQQQEADNMVRIRADPLQTSDLQSANKEIDTQIDKDRKILTLYQTLRPILPPILLRIGNAYAVADENWRAAVVFGELMRSYPQQPEVEPALYASIIAFERVKQPDRAMALCGNYLAKYPNGKYADNVAYFQGILAYEAEEFDQSVAYFEASLKNQLHNPHKEQIELMLGDIQLRAGKFDQALAAYQKFETDYPQSPHLEAATYRSALALLFGGKSDEADAAIRGYMTKYPAGAYIPDAAYRLAVVKFAAKQYAEVISQDQQWQQKYGTAAPLAEVLTLSGDSYASLGQQDEALKAYTGAYEAAQTDDVLSYALFAAAKILQKEQRWPDILAMFQKFIKTHPDSRLLVESVAWIGRADIKLGKVDEAKQFMADTAKQYLNDPSREGVDDILVQLAQLFVKKHLALAPDQTPAAAGANPAVAVETPATLEQILTIPDLDQKPTAAARILYAQSELARLQRKPDVEAQILLQIAGKFKPEDLSPALLGQVGDCLLQSGQPDQAALFYHYLLDEYAQSHLVDFAYNGLGRIAFDQKDYKKALDYYSKAIDKGVALARLKEITLGQAQSLLALHRLDEAKQVFEQVASNRAWRGEATAFSVFSLGQIQMQQMNYAEANAFFQRVYVAYQKYPAIQAEAYLNSGIAFEKLSKVPEAVNTYNEMLRIPALSAFPESQEARNRLQNLVQK